MPELPEVEHFRRFLARHGSARRITRVEVLDASVLRNVSRQHLRRDIEGRRFLSPRRHGKWLIARTDGPTLLLHFGMTGELVWKTRPDERHPHDRVVFVLEHGEVRYRDQRKLQGIWLARDEREAKRIMGHQGPDALDVDDPGFHELLAEHRGRIKAVLMDQERGSGTLPPTRSCGVHEFTPLVTRTSWTPQRSGGCTGRCSAYSASPYGRAAFPTGEGG